MKGYSYRYVGCVSGRPEACECGKTPEYVHKIANRQERSVCRECAEKVLCRSEKYMPLFAEKSFQGGWDHVVSSKPPYGWMSRWHIEEVLR